MTESQERRAPGVQRVAVVRVVDICGRDATVPAFEAQSVELSGRGMHVKTPYLPPPGAPLVCRLEESGREIIVEGVVAWVKEVEGGGEFGMRFTALDSGSVETLKELCGMDAPEPAAPAGIVEEPATKASPAPTGTAVKLHIDGLGAPMKARVKDAGSRKLQVGSNLEFLKVGRGLEVENLEEGERRGAKIDAVSIAIDPATQVPQLVVVLRYEGADTTPEPSVVGAEEPHAIPIDAVAEATAASEPAEMDDGDEGEFTDSADELRDRVDAFAADFGKVAQKTGKKLASASGKAASHFMKWARAGAGRLSEAAARRNQDQRRSTSRAPTIVAGQRRLRPQNGVAAEEPSNPRRKLIIAGAAGALVLVSAVGIAMASHSGKSDAQPVAAASIQTPPLAALPNAAMAANLPAQPATLGAQGAMLAASAGQPGAPAPGGQRPGVVANVPLFGPTPMATLEPAPLGPPPEGMAAVPGAGSATPQGSLVPPATEERMDDESSAAAHDESFDSADKKDPEKKTSEVKPEDVKPWGEGAMHLPVVYRLKLDEPGAALKGTKQAKGFTVVIPHRKVVDGGTSITKRDDRIAEVRTKNGPEGAHVTFAFRSKVPTFKVRLRKSYVEFFISSP